MGPSLPNDALGLLVATKNQLAESSFKAPVPSDIDSMLVGVGKFVAAMGPKDLEQLAADIKDESIRSMLVLFPRRLAVLALRGGDTQNLEVAVMLVCLECQKYDWRESLATVAILAHVCARRSVSFSAIVKKLLDRVPSASRDFLLGLLESPPEPLTAFFFREVETPSGLDIVKQSWA